VRPSEVAALYKDVCEGEGLPFHGSSAGSISWDCDDFYLKAVVGPREEIHPARLDHFVEYPRVRRFSFPLPTVVEVMIGALLGSGQKKNLMFGALLSDLGRATRMHTETVVTASLLWHFRGSWVNGKPKIPRSEEAAELLNRFLLEPLDKPSVDTTRNHSAWADAKKVAYRFDRCRFLLQELGDRRFSNGLSTSP
jgi:hypothetical protein